MARKCYAAKGRCVNPAICEEAGVCSRKYTYRKAKPDVEEEASPTLETKPDRVSGGAGDLTYVCGSAGYERMKDSNINNRHAQAAKRRTAPWAPPESVEQSEAERAWSVGTGTRNDKV